MATTFWWSGGHGRSGEPSNLSAMKALARCVLVSGGLSGLSFAVMWAGIMLTPILLCNLIVGSLAGSNMLADILPQVHPAIALGISIVVIPAGLFLYCFCATRRDAPLPGQHGNPRNRKNEQPKPDGADRSPGGH